MNDFKQMLMDLLTTTAKQAASDLHIAVGRRPTLRIDGVLVPLQKEQITTPEIAEGIMGELMTPEQKQKLIQQKQVDFAYSFEDKARFRVNVYYQRGYLAAALRLVPARIKTIEELNLPPLLHDLAKLSQGFVLIVGPAGHGKSSTLAALIDERHGQKLPRRLRPQPKRRAALAKPCVAPGHHGHERQRQRAAHCSQRVFGPRALAVVAIVAAFEDA